MKKLILIALCLQGLLVSCDSDCPMDNSNNDCLTMENIDHSSKSPIVDMRQYNTFVVENFDAISEWYLEVQNYLDDSNGGKGQGLNAFEDIDALYKSAEYTSIFLPVANDFVEKLEITREDMEEILETKIVSQNEYNNAIVNILIFSSIMDICRIDDNNDTGTFTDCFLEATGIAAGVVIIGNLGKGIVTKAILKQMIQLALKLGGRTMNGIGLALLAAEIGFCMMG